MRKLILQNSAANLSYRAGREAPGRKKSLVQKIFLLAFVVQLCAAGNLSAQWDHWGGGVGSAPTNNYTTSSSNEIANYVRAHYSGSYTVSMTSAPLLQWYGTISFDNEANPGTGDFQNGDIIMIVQMDANLSATRNYDLAQITSSP